jgi:hypothetical protein
MDWICNFGHFWCLCFHETGEAFDHWLLYFELAAIVSWWWFDHRNKTKDAVAKKREGKLKKRFRIACLLVLPLYFFVVAPFVQYREAEEARKHAEDALNAKPRPIRKKYINLANQLIERAAAGEKLKAEGKWNPFSFWAGVLDEFQSRIEKGRIELAENGQRSDKFNELAMWLEINHLMQLPPSVLRDMAMEMKRMAEQLDE